MARATATRCSFKKKYSDDRSSSCCEARSAQREAPVSVQKKVCDVEVSFYASDIRLGILEKKKDFQKRAKHIHKKRDLIDTLKQKAFLRNPEEFAYGMINAEKNSVGQIDLGFKKTNNPHSVHGGAHEESRSFVRETRTDGQGVARKYRFERKR